MRISAPSNAVLVALLCTQYAAAAGTNSLSSGKMTLTVTETAYSIGVEGEVWFTSAEAAAGGGYSFSADGQTYRAIDGTMRLVKSPTMHSGSDAVGDFAAISLSWTRNSSTSVTAEWVSTFKAYRDQTAISFVQQWPSALGNSTGGSVFPSFQQANEQHRRLGALEYTGSSCGFMVAAQGNFPGVVGGPSKGYVVLSPEDTEGSGAPVTFALGPVREHFANQATNVRGKALAYGMAATFETVPAGFVLETVLTASIKSDGGAGWTMASDERASIPAGGVNGALLAFGDFLLGAHAKKRARGDHTIETAYLGYSTTGFYFYNLCDCEDKPASTPLSNHLPDPHNRQTCSKGGSSIPKRFLQGALTTGVCASYADTLVAVNDALTEQRIPVRHILLDSWWYGEGWNSGASLWEDSPKCVGTDNSSAPAAWPAGSFPLGLKAFHEQLGTDKVIWAHNGKWSPSSPYRDEFEFSGATGAPQGRALWDHLFSKGRQWGLSTIKQDHMGEQIRVTKDAYQNLTVLTSWLSGMGEAASDNGVGVLYCCAPPSVHMAGVTVPAAYAVRASPDYVWGAGGKAIKLPTVQWAIGPDNAFHWNGLGLLPYKDTFISNSSSTQKSGGWTDDSDYFPSFKGYHELNAATHALMSLLSMGPVTFADAVAEANRTLLMQLAREDGVLLKPDRPATAIDAQFQAMLFNSWPGEDTDASVVSAGVNGALALYGGDGEENELARRAEIIFPASAGMSDGYRSAYTRSAALMKQIEERQCKRGRAWGSPQGPLGEIYATHVSVGGMTWRYIVGVQLASDREVRAHELNAAACGGSFVSYVYDYATTFRPSAELREMEGDWAVTLRKGDGASCATSPAFNISTPCFPFQLVAVAPVMSNGWALLGEVGKFVPVSRQRISEVAVLDAGGFMVSLLGSPGETVTVGGVNVHGRGRPVYKTAVIGTDGRGVVEMK